MYREMAISSRRAGPSRRSDEEHPLAHATENMPGVGDKDMFCVSCKVCSKFKLGASPNLTFLVERLGGRSSLPTHSYVLSTTNHGGLDGLQRPEITGTFVLRSRQSRRRLQIVQKIN